MFGEKSQANSDEYFMVFVSYPDTVTTDLLDAVCEVTQASKETILKLLGTHFVAYCMRHGYDKMLKTLGSDIFVFIQNLDSLHYLLSVTYKGIVAPSFRCERDVDDDLLLHYYSKRKGYYPIVIGMVEAVSKSVFNQAATVTVISQSEEKTGESCIMQHVVLKVHLESGWERYNTALAPTIPNDADAASFNQDSVIKSGDICRALPYHFVLGEDMRLLQCGDNIRRLTRIAIRTHMPFTSVACIVHPHTHHTIPDILSFINADFLIAIFTKPDDESQMIWMEHSRLMLFIGSPRLTSIDELFDTKIFMSDIPLYDATRELVASTSRG
ncbi:hypothetical protein ACOMHN_053369 [Nucella lapillus]